MRQQTFDETNEKTNNENNNLFFSKNKAILIVLVLFLAIFVKTIYLKDSIIPTATDLGHHMYWAKLISTTGQLPNYQERDIIENNGHYQISAPRKIDDFIIGEHLIFAAINLVSGLDFISAFPSLVLFLAHIFSLLTIFILTIRLFKNFENDIGDYSPILALLFVGPVFAISGSQAKFVSGGVVGNILGNLLIPLFAYFLTRALMEKKSLFMALAAFTALGLAYIHHLSAFILIFIFLFAVIIFLFSNIKRFFSFVQDWLKIILSWPVVLALIFATVMFLVYLPTYLNTTAIDTAVGHPEKPTRTGLSLPQIKYAAGETRLALALAAVIFLIFSQKIKNYPGALISGWFLAIFIMTYKPQLLFIDIPSNRIVNYLSFPTAILSALSASWFIHKIKNSDLGPAITTSAIGLLLIAVIAGGFYDNSQSLKTTTKMGPALETFAAARYLSDKTSSSDIVLKDHNYVLADAWIKLFFMRDYNFPFSRGLLKRYEDKFSKREMCTLWMISAPNLPSGEKCYADLGVNFVMINPRYDAGQFAKSKKFDAVYANDNVGIFYRNKKQ